LSMLRFDLTVSLTSKIYSRYLFKRAGKGVKIKAGCIIDSPENIEVGNYFNLGEYSFVSGQGGVFVGNNVMIGHHVSILSSEHVYDKTHIPMREQGARYSFVKIEDDVWIGAGARILKGVLLGKGSIVASNAVVSKPVAPYSIVGGVPAHLIKTRIMTV